MSAEIKTRIDESRVDINSLIPLTEPLNILLDPSSSCNLRCTFCATSDAKLMKSIGKYRGNMGLELYKKIIDDLSLFPNKVKNLHLAKDGEPLLNKYLPEMIAYAKKSGCIEQVTVTTNATLLTKDMSEKLVEAGLDRLRISLEGLNSDDYKRIAKTNIDFELLVENIQYFCKIKENCHVFIKVPENCISPKQIPLFYSLFENYADSFSLEQIVDVALDFSIPAEYHVDKKQGMFKQEYIKKDVCGFIFYSIAVSAEGLVAPCCMDWSQELTIGDTRTQSLHEIWNSNELQLLRIQHLQGQKDENPVCVKCDAPSLCCVENIDPEKERILTVMNQLNIDHSKKIPGMSNMLGNISVKVF